jgi:hypothetical protein
MAFVPSSPPWFVASPLGTVYPLASTAEVSKLATSDAVGLPRTSNFNVMLGISKSNRQDGAPTRHAANWTWLGDGSSMQWIQQDSSSELVPILGGTAAWFFEYFVHRRDDLKQISAESLRKLLAGNVTSNGVAATGIGQLGQSKWRLVDAPADPVPCVRHFIASLDVEGPRATAACHRGVSPPHADHLCSLLADRGRAAKSSRDVAAASAPPGAPRPIRVEDPSRSNPPKTPRVTELSRPTAGPSCVLISLPARRCEGFTQRRKVRSRRLCTFRCALTCSRHKNPIRLSRLNLDQRSFQPCTPQAPTTHPLRRISRVASGRAGWATLLGRSPAAALNKPP